MTYSPDDERCPKCGQLGVDLEFHAEGHYCRTPSTCRNVHGNVLDEMEHMLVTCRTCKYRVRREIEHFQVET